MNLFDTTNLFSRFQAFHKVLSPTRPKELKFFVANTLLYLQPHPKAIGQHKITN